MLREHAERKRRAWAIAFSNLARKHGEGSNIYKAMGSLAWGRHEGEPSRSDSKDNAVFGFGYLRGQRDALLAVARLLDWDCERDLANLWNEADEIERRAGGS